MRCASCGEPLIPGKAFCHACGAPAASPCPHCGARVEPRFRFCPDCGRTLGEAVDPAPSSEPARPVEPARSEADLARYASRIPDELARKIRGSGAVIAGERKQVTVLFCDLTGSTAIAGELDPEEYRDLLDRYLELTFAEIYRYEGIVNQLAGDGLMALFGAPIAHEDAPERAVRAAIAIRASLARLSDERKRAGRPELRARIGIHTGPVVVGTVGNDLKMDYTAIGDTTNLASRLQSLASPGAVLISATTERLVRGRFETRAVGPFDVRGKSERVMAFEVARACETDSPMALAEARGMTPWIGRDAELAMLRDCFGRLSGQLPQLVSVVGDAGSGKSRLLYEFKRWLGDQQAVLFEARCASLTQSVAYAPWIAMLRGFFGLRARDGGEPARERVREQLIALNPALEAEFEMLNLVLRLPARDLPEMSPDDLRGRMFDAVNRVVLAVSKRGPVVMMIEDLHWIDEPSRAMLERAASELDRWPFMLLVSHRPDYQPSWNVRTAFTQLYLRPLPAEDLRQIVRACAGGELPPELERRILIRAEGNPFFAEELVRSLDEQGAFVRSNGSLGLSRPVDEIRIPDTVQELIGARLDRLPAPAKRVAQLASVLGRQFTREQLASLLDGEEVDLESELTTLVGRGVLHRKDASAPDEFRFGESLVQQVAYESLLLRERRRLHARVAEALEKQAADGGDPSYTVLAFHHARAEQPEPAIEALLAAAGRAAALPSYPQALELYRKAWDLAETAIDHAAPEARERLQRGAVRAGLGLCQMLVVHGPPEVGEGEAIAIRAGELARVIGDEEAHASILGYQGMLALSRDGERLEEGIALISRAYELARAAGLEVRALTIGRGLAWAQVVDGRLAEGIGLLRHILDELERLGEKERGSDAYMGARYFHERARLLADDLDGLEEALAETLALAERVRNRTVYCATLATLGQLHLQRGRFAEALALAEPGLEIAERIGSAAAVRTAAAIALLAAMALGRSDSTRRWVESIDRSVEQVGDLAISSLLLVEALLAAGDLPRAQRLAELSLRRARGRLHTLFATIAHGMVRVRLGGEQPGEPERALKRALALARELGLRSAEIAALVTLAELARSRDEAALATELARKADSLVDSTGFERYRARTRCVIDGCSADCATLQP